MNSKYSDSIARACARDGDLPSCRRGRRKRGRIVTAWVTEYRPQIVQGDQVAARRCLSFAVPSPLAIRRSLRKRPHAVYLLDHSLCLDCSDSAPINRTPVGAPARL